MQRYVCQCRHRRRAATRSFLPPAKGATTRWDTRPQFKEDGAEGAGLDSISEWWLEPHTPGPGAFTLDDVFYVIETMITWSVTAGCASKGAFVLAPGAFFTTSRTGAQHARALSTFPRPVPLSRACPRSANGSVRLARSKALTTTSWGRQTFEAGQRRRGSTRPPPM